MKLLGFEDWYDKYGEAIEGELYDYFDNCKYHISDKHIENIVNDVIEKEYEDYIATYYEQRYEYERDERLLDAD